MAGWVIPAGTTTPRRLEEWPDLDAEVVEPAWLRERRALAWQALAGLPAGQRQVIELAYFDGLTPAEVAARLGVPLGTVTAWLQLGLHTLQELDT